MADVDTKDTKKKSFKNYVILVVIFLVGMGLTLYLCQWYRVYDDYQKETPVIRNALLEITHDDFEHYMMENPTTVIYMCTARDEKCRSFEKDFKKLIKREELNDYIVYLNLTDIDQNSFVEEFNNKYNFKVKLTTQYPAFVVFEDGNVNSILQGDDGKDTTVSKVKQFLELNEIGE